MAGLSDITNQAQQFWTSRNKQQKMLLVAGVAATALLLTIFAGMLGSPDYKPLYTGLEAADAQTISAQLDAQGIPHQTSADGKTISVPADKLDVARMQAASQGMPHSGRMGFELFDKMSWGETEFDEKVTYQRALEGELERTIATLSDVKSARVHLVMPTDSIYDDQQRNGKASVILKLNGDNLSKDAVLAIARLVSGAVDGLKPEDVCIIDADSDKSLNLPHDGAMQGEGLEASLTQQLVSTLEPVVGVGAIRASVNVDYDQGSSEESDEKYDPTVSALLSDQKSQDQAGGGMATGGVPGVTSNVPSAKPVQAASATAQQAAKQKGGTQKAGTLQQGTSQTGTQIGTPQNAMQLSTTENARYGVNRVVEHRVTPAGQLERISAAILVDDEVVKTVHGGKVTFTHHARSQAELSQIQQLAQAVIGFDAKRGDTLTVQDMAFAADTDEGPIAPPGMAEKVQKAVSDYSSLIRPASLLMLFLMAYLFVLRPIQKQVLAQRLALPGEQHSLERPMHSEQLALAATESAEGTRRAGQLKEETIDLIKQKPTNTARAVEAWLREEAS
ncbi:MAG: flagellar basal-body MS-ring/collar protein FliF [Acidobacteriaceae bacterium]